MYVLCATKLLELLARTERGLCDCTNVLTWHAQCGLNRHCLQDVVVGMKFGQFGREDGVLLMITQGGALSIKILKRSVNFEVKDMTPGPPGTQLEKLNIPKRTKVYVDQMAREKESGTGKRVQSVE